MKRLALPVIASRSSASTRRMETCGRVRPAWRKPCSRLAVMAA